MVTRDLAALYGIKVTYYPPEEVQYSRVAWGHIELTATNERKDWRAAWERATRAERVRYCRWHATVICRVWAGIADELGEGHSGLLMSYVSTDGVVDPVKAQEANDWPGFIAFAVRADDPDEAKRWVARTRGLVNEVIANDAAALAVPQQEDHAGVLLSEQPAATEERTT